MSDKNVMADDKKKKHNDIILIAVLLIAACSLFVYAYMIKPHKKMPADASLILEISSDNDVIYKSALKDMELPFTYEVKAKDGGYNIFTAEITNDGQIGISCSEADCPDKVCVKTGVITLSDEVIVCLPHKTVARLYTAQE